MESKTNLCEGFFSLGREESWKLRVTWVKGFSHLDEGWKLRVTCVKGWKLESRLEVGSYKLEYKTNLCEGLAAASSMWPEYKQMKAVLATKR